MSDFYTQLNQVLKYGADDWNTFQSILTQQPHHRWGGDKADHTLRKVAADAYQEHTNDEAGADLLRDPNQHVILKDGQVKKGKFTTEHIDNASEDISNHVNLLEGGHRPFRLLSHHEVHDRTPAHYGDEAEGMSEQERNTPYGYGHYRIHQHYADPSRNYGFTTHISEMGKHFAEHADRELARVYDNAPAFDHLPQHEREAAIEQHSDHLDTLLHRQRNAPYEEEA